MLKGVRLSKASLGQSFEYVRAFRPRVNDPGVLTTQKAVFTRTQYHIERCPSECARPAFHPEEFTNEIRYNPPFCCIANFGAPSQIWLSTGATVLNRGCSALIDFGCQAKLFRRQSFYCARFKTE